MRVRLPLLFISGVLAACGGDDQATETMTSMPATMSPSAGTVTTGPGESDNSSDMPPTSDTASTAPVAGAPVFLSLQTNVSKITAGESVIFTAVLTDPDGVDDIVGGTLSDVSGMIGYGPFVAAGQEGTYSVSLSWDAVNQAQAIQFEGMDLKQIFRAEFYDQAANKVHQDVELTLTCVEGSACGGVCTDIMVDADHCGACGKVCEGGCGEGQCAPKWGECINASSGFDTCDLYCPSIGETCVENACGPLTGTIRAFTQTTDCEAEKLGSTVKQPCSMVQTWGMSPVVQCCCSDTK